MLELWINILFHHRGRGTYVDCSMCDDEAEESAPSIIKVRDVKQSITSLLAFQSKLFPHYYVDKCKLIGVPKLNRNGKPPSSVQINLRTFICKYFRETSYFYDQGVRIYVYWYMCVGVSDEHVASIIQVEKCNLTDEFQRLRIIHAASMISTNVLMYTKTFTKVSETAVPSLISVAKFLVCRCFRRSCLNL